MREDYLIFVVEDDPVYLKLIEHHFEKAVGYKVMAFTSGEDCLTKMHMSPNIVLLDFHLESGGENNMTGLQVLEKIKENHPDTDVIMLTALDRTAVAVECMRLGAFDYIVKSETALVKIDHAIALAFHVKKIARTKTVAYITTGAVIAVFVTLMTLHFVFPGLLEGN